MTLNTNELNILMAEIPLNNRELSEKSGVSMGTIRNALSGKSCTRHTVFKIADALGCGVRDIVNLED